ncbi:Pimeloyl-ACP methyl ester carboxylesterase [Terribacillus halophilus]|uniref:Pimeloyl-ACP methyl ester carboxylesterase n=1 Tax=Terribacillus halophilus TaxID=361279 RepID=A0A1G6QYW3_9BACI|nr:alpha/beta hydrolase [Terribacillus halophilus]SDC97498.1 Pimeloyl-ACP methyl ester carboxylesterase [Terribacillus halophilus]
MPYCRIGDTEIYYEEAGEGTPIIMIHGYSPDHRLMSGCMEPIFKNKKGWRRIYLDLPGMGKTKHYQQISSSDEMLEMVANFIHTIIPHQVYAVAGESYGGYLTRGLLEREPEKILGAALICPVIKPNFSERDVEEHIVRQEDNELKARLTAEEWDDFRSNNVILNSYTWERYNKEIVGGCAVSDAEFLDKVKQRYAFSFDIDKSIFRSPAVFLMGRQDDVVGYKDALDIMELFPEGSFAVLDTAGHNLQIEQPAIFQASITDWLNRMEHQGK